MRPSADQSHPQKRRRFENGPANSSTATTQANSFPNNTGFPPRHPVSNSQHSNPAPFASHQQRSLNQSNGARNPQARVAVASTDIASSAPFPQTIHGHSSNPRGMRMPFVTPANTVQNSSFQSTKRPWPSQVHPASGPEFSVMNALDDFFTNEPNRQTTPSLAEPQFQNHQSLLNSSIQNNTNFPPLLPPLMPGKAPSLGPLDPHSMFPPSDNNFPITAPLPHAFLPSDSLANISTPSPTAATSYPLQGSSSVPSPAMRQRLGPRTQNGLGSGSHQTSGASHLVSGQPHHSRILPPKPGITPIGDNTGALPKPLTLRKIPPVKKALELFRDSSPVIVALAQTVMQRGGLNIPASAMRNRILDFSGFRRNQDPQFHWLVALSKSDLDVLAWVFVVSKHGRKDDVAKRIVTSLRAPLKFRVPPLLKKPNIPTRSEANTSSLNTLAAAIRNIPQPNHTSSTRTNMPSLAPGSLLNPRGHTILSNLERQLTPSSGRGTTILSSQSNGRLSSQANKSKQTQNLFSEVISDYTFDVGENPFNCPMNTPLGSKPYVFFSSVQLSRGNNDPALRFETPAPIDKAVRPEVAGGEVQVHIRCLRVEIEKPKSEWKQAWPFPATCRVNGNCVTLNQAQRYTNGKLAGRDAATNITPFLRKFKESGARDMNRVVLRRQASTATAAAGQYVFFAQEILVLSHETMTNSVFEASDKYWVEHRANLEKKGTITSATSKFEMARQGVMHFLTDPDGLTVSSMKVSLRCPLALTRIATPVKGKKCQHVQCFDLENFLEYARRSSKFDCPVCNKNTAYPASLIISPYIEHALATFSDCDEVEINQDGRMVAVERKQTGVASDDDEEADVKAEPRKIPSRSRGAVGTGGAKAPEVVDLTLDSDDEDGVATNEDDEGEAIRPDTTSSIPLTSGDYLRTPGAPMGAPGNQIGGSSPPEQDVFSFRADFCWREPHVSNSFGSSATRMQQSQADVVRDNWASDVIAIDSD